MTVLNLSYFRFSRNQRDKDLTVEIEKIVIVVDDQDLREISIIHQNNRFERYYFLQRSQRFALKKNLISR